MLETDGRKRTDAEEALMEDAVVEAEASELVTIVSWVRESDAERVWSSAR